LGLLACATKSGFLSYLFEEQFLETNLLKCITCGKIILFKDKEKVLLLNQNSKNKTFCKIIYLNIL
jgi:hypothetical protein